jgi:hypothetical protein
MSSQTPELDINKPTFWKLSISDGLVLLLPKRFELFAADQLFVVLKIEGRNPNTHHKALKGIT